MADVVARAEHVYFVAVGEPRPKGSFRPYTYRRKDGSTGARATNDNTKTKPWQAIVATAAAIARRGVFFDVHVPVAVTIDFYFPRPKSVTSTKRPAMVVKPDLDKVLRSTKDALTGVLWADDAQVISCQIHKRYAAPGDPPRAEIAVWRHEEAVL